MATVARLTDPKVLLNLKVQDLFRAAFMDNPIVPEGFDANAGEFVRMVQSPGTHVLLGADDGELRGLAIVVMPQDKLVGKPQVFHFYCDKSLPLRKALIRKVVDTVLQNGYTTFYAMNATDKPDSVWARTFRLAGEAVRKASVMEFTIK